MLKPEACKRWDENTFIVDAVLNATINKQKHFNVPIIFCKSAQPL